MWSIFGVLHAPPLFSWVGYIGFITGMWNQKTNWEKVWKGSWRNRNKHLKEGKLFLCRSLAPNVCCSCQTIEKLVICLLKGDRDQQYVAILLKNQKRAKSNKQWPGTKKIQKGRFRCRRSVSKRQATRKSGKKRIDVWPFVEERHETQNKENPIFVAILSFQSQEDLKKQPKGE